MIPDSVNRRTVLAAACVGLLVATAGCTGLFGNDVSDDDLAKEPPAPYEWNSSRDVFVSVHTSNYQAVYNLSATNTSKLDLYRNELTSNEPLFVRSVRYRFPNGTVVNGTHPAVEVGREGDSRVIEVPREEGKLAFTSSSSDKQWGTPGFASGSTEVVLPPDRRVDSFLFARVNPGGYETSVDDDNRLHLTWDEVSGSIYVRYYLIRDILLFRGLVVVLAVAALAGAGYYLRQIRKLQRRREELGLDVDADDDEFGRDPPPGMR